MCLGVLVFSIGDVTLRGGWEIQQRNGRTLLGLFHDFAGTSNFRQSPMVVSCHAILANRGESVILVDVTCQAAALTTLAERH